MELQWKGRPTGRQEDTCKIKVHLMAIRHKNVACGTLGSESCKTADSSASSEVTFGPIMRDTNPYIISDTHK
jgi:hypothetical protein